MTNNLRIVTLEEHFAPYGFANGDGGAFVPAFASSVSARISDIETVRLPEMDSAGVDVQVLSLTTPGVQGVLGGESAVEYARRSNEAMAEIVARHPERFSAFAALPTQDPKAASDELRRCVQEWGFVGALVNGHTHGRYLDDPAYGPLWATLEDLQVPLYLHPSFPAVTPSVLEGFSELWGPSWGWGFETGSHALRLILSGVFDRHPSAQLLLGHMGENILFGLDRLDDRLAILQGGRELALNPSDYIRRNMLVTTSGVESSAPLRHAIDVLGIDRVLFSVDYPYQSMQSAVDFLTSQALEADHLAALASGNADRILRLRDGR
jgi:2,3-dihydroxybenzoate decarboxylase